MWTPAQVMVVSITHFHEKSPSEIYFDIFIWTWINDAYHMEVIMGNFAALHTVDYFASFL